MHRSTARWTTGLAAAALIAVPAAGFAQSTTTAPPTPPAQSAAPETPASQTADSTGTPADHVREAKQALSNIPTESLTVADRAKIAQLRTHLNALDRAVASPTAAEAPRVVNGRMTASSNNWATDVAEIDTILTGMIGPETAPDATSAMPTGTTGKAGELNDQARTQLLVVRRHVTELASAMSGTSGASAHEAITTTTPRTDQPAAAAVLTSSPDMTATASQAAAAAAASATSATPPPGSAATPPATSAAAATTPPTTAPPTTAPPTPTTGSQVDTAGAKQHLSEARDTLSQLTSLPEAAKLQGDARTQVSQLISNFNELITTPTDWRASYAKVDADLTTLLGPDANQPPPAAATDVTASGVAGATGTSGTVPPASVQPTTVQLDPAIRTKLVEFRTQLKAFEQAAGGSTPKTVQ